MEAKQLRIGNYLKTDNSTKYFEDVIIVESIQHNGINITDGQDNSYITEFEWDFLKPIPLTEQWFVNFGLQKDVFKDHRNYTPLEIRADNGDGDFMHCKISDGLFLSGCSRNIKFVHDLQNLYFALTGEELKHQK